MADNLQLPRMGVNVSAGTLQAVSGTVLFSNANGLVFGIGASGASSRITGSVAGAVGIRSLSAGTTQITNGTAVLADNVDFRWGMNGSTITAAQNGSYSFLANSYNLGAFFGTLTYGASLTFGFRTQLDRGIAATRGDMDILLPNDATGYTISMSAFSFTTTTASSISSAARTQTWVTSVASDYSGARWRSIPFGTWAFTPGDYSIQGTLSMISTAGGAALVYGGYASPNLETTGFVPYLQIAGTG